jgi:hypothetical protein
MANGALVNNAKWVPFAGLEMKTSFLAEIQPVEAVGQSTGRRLPRPNPLAALSIT